MIAGSEAGAPLVRDASPIASTMAHRPWNGESQPLLKAATRAPSDPNASPQAPGEIPGPTRHARPAPYLSVVSPVYKGEKSLPELCRRLTDTISPIADSFEIILVCDGSPDESWTVMQALAREYPNLIAVNLSRNFGQHYASTAGLDLARGEWTVILDCDLQEPPEAIPQLLEKAESGYDIVIARRVGRQHVWWKRATSKLFYRIFSTLSGYRLDSSIGTFRIMRRPVVEGFCSMRESYRMFAGLIEWLGFKTAYVDVAHAAREEGESSYNFSKLLGLALDSVISFSNRPLHLSIALGFTMSIASALFGIYLIGSTLIVGDQRLPGWVSTMTINAFIGGLILLNQGVLGVYLGRLYNQAKGRPLYVVDKIVVGADRFSEEADG